LIFIRKIFSQIFGEIAYEVQFVIINDLLACCLKQQSQFGNLVIYIYSQVKLGFGVSEEVGVGEYLHLQVRAEHKQPILVRCGVVGDGLHCDIKVGIEVKGGEVLMGYL
jgi:hypothetical protein